MHSHLKNTRWLSHSIFNNMTSTDEPILQWNKPARDFETYETSGKSDIVHCVIKQMDTKI